MGPIFKGTLRRGWRTMLFWGVGIGLIGAFNVFALPDVDGMKAAAEAISKMPPFILQMLGGGDLAFLASPEGYLNNQYYAIALAIFSVYAIIAGLNITANEEERGAMDVLLTMPVTRWRVIVEKYIAYAVLMSGAIVLSTVVLWLSLQVTPAATVPTSTLIAASFSILPGALIVLAFTASTATIVRRRNTTAAIAVLFLLVSWFVDILGRTATTSIIHSARVASFYAYYDTASVMQHGVSLTNILVPFVAALILIGAAVFAFERRNIAV